ncbi:MAG: FGGY-family carbohydrate kinase [Candidatus Methanofastidiosia archaeon]
MSYVLAYDLGTGGCKTILADLHGRILSSTFEEYQVLYPKKGFAEQDPNIWWKSILISTQKVMKGIPKEEILGISFSSQMIGTLPLDRDGKPLRNCMIWLDTRSGKQARWIIEHFGPGRLLKITGGIPSERDFISKVLWLKEKEKRIFEKTHKFSDCKDYLIFRCTGEFVTDLSCASVTGFFNTEKKVWSDELCEIVGITQDELSRVLKSTDVVGELNSKASRELGLERKTLVICGGGDVATAALGAGALKIGDAHLNLGTSAWVGVNVEERILDPMCGIGSMCSAIPESFILIGEMESAGACLRWLRDELGDSEKLKAEKEEKNVFEVFDEIADSVEPGSKDLIFTPWMWGERAPLVDEYVRGGFFNLSLEHKKCHMIRSVLEGVSYHLRWIAETLEELDLKIEELNVVGGGAKSDIWLQILSDVTLKDIKKPKRAGDACAMGALMIALVGLDIYENFDSLKDLIVMEKKFKPQSENKTKYERLYENFKKIYEMLSEVHEKLNKRNENIL